jgi:hypothetical protein
MSASGPYSRVYHSLVDDADFAGIYDDDAAFATWVRLLMVADASYPSPAPVPRSAKRRTLMKLSDAGLVQLLPGERFTVRGLAPERERRSSKARNAANIRYERERSASAVQPHSDSSASALPRREETRKEETSNGANAPGSTGVMMGFRPRADADAVKRQADDEWKPCSECGVLGRKHSASGEHKFQPVPA